MRWPAMFFALVNVLVVANLYAAERQRDGLATQATDLERTLQRLQTRGVTVGTGLESGENPFTADLPTTELTATVVQAAQQSGTTLTVMQALPTANESFAQNTYRTYALRLGATGTPAQLSDFLARVERGTVKAWVIDNAQARPSASQPGLWEIAFDTTAYARA